MAKNGKAPPWRGRFLRALARHANVRLAAAQTGGDYSAAYRLRLRDADFARRWEVALAKGRGRAGGEEGDHSGGSSKLPLHRLRRSPSPAAAGEELIVRRLKTGGAKLVRAGAGRWNAGAEERFFAELARTACAEWAAKAAGFSTTALYNRRKNYPDFAEKWRVCEAEARERLHGIVVAAGIASFDPTAAWGEGLPKVSVSEAIAILRLKPPSAAPGTGPAKVGGFEEPSIEEVRANILRKLDAIEAAERRSAGAGD